MTKTLLDLFCKAGGGAMGYHRAGYEIIGVDKDLQPHYPFQFIQADALEYLADHLKTFDAYHASPPCQKHSTMTNGLWKDRVAGHPDLIAPCRAMLIQTGRPYIIENVPQAPLKNPVMLCGSMLSLGVRRHRLFETSFTVTQPKCNHKAQGPIVGVYGHSGGKSTRDGLTFPGISAWKTAMQIDWMTGAELAEAIPPAYTQYIAQFIPNGENP